MGQEFQRFHSGLTQLIAIKLGEEYPKTIYWFLVKGAISREKVYCGNKLFTSVVLSLEDSVCFVSLCYQVRYYHSCDLNQEKISSIPIKNQSVYKCPTDFQCLRFNDMASLTFEYSMKVNRFLVNSILCLLPLSYSTLVLKQINNKQPYSLGGFETQTGVILHFILLI